MIYKCELQSKRSSRLAFALRTKKDERSQQDSVATESEYMMIDMSDSGFLLPHSVRNLHGQPMVHVHESTVCYILIRSQQPKHCSIHDENTPSKPNIQPSLFANVLTLRDAKIFRNHNPSRCAGDSTSQLIVVPPAGENLHSC